MKADAAKGGAGTLKKRLTRDWNMNKWKYVMIIPVLVYLALFCYKPMYGLIIAFKAVSYTHLEMSARMEQTRLLEKHGSLSFAELFQSGLGQALILTAGGVFMLILIAGVLMISSSINSSIAQRVKFFGMMRCIGMSRRQIIRFVRLEALNWCKTAVPIGLVLGIIASWGLCAALRFLVGEEFSNIPLFGFSIIGIVSGIVVGVVTVLLAARAPARRAAKVSPAAAVSGSSESAGAQLHPVKARLVKIETALGICLLYTSRCV